MLEASANPDDNRLPDYDTADADLSCLVSDRIDAIQDERLKRLVRYAHVRSGFWREKLERNGVSPDTFRGLSDLTILPFCSKAELQADQSSHPPFGSYACSDRETWVRFFSTSGTTGAPLFRVLSRRDWRLVLGGLGRGARWSSSDTIFLTAPTDGLLGPTGAMEMARSAGALVIQGGTWRTSRKISTIRRMRPTIVSGSASYLAYLLEAARSEGVDLRDCGIERLSCVGEPGANVAETKQLLMRGYGVGHISDGYGITELFPLGGNCAFSSELHLKEDMVVVECLEPGTNNPVPAGTPGELVFTNIVGDTQPVIRYRTGDIAILADRAPCACGHTHRRIKSIMGRADDMIWYRGVNFFPSAVENIVHGFPELTSEYQIRLEDDHHMPKATIVVESEAGDATLKQRLSVQLKDGLGISPDVEIVAVGALPRSEDGGKSRRVVDTRKSNRTGDAK